MKKSIYFFVILSVIAFLCACTHGISTKVSLDISEAEAAVSQEISPDNSTEDTLDISEAKAAVSQEINRDDNDNLIIEVEGDRTVDGVDYYFVHVYSESSEPLEGPDGSEFIWTFTYGWYYVNKTTGEVIDYLFGSL